MSDELVFDLDDLTIEEIELLEEKTGVPIDEIGGKGIKKGTMLRTMAYIMKRRENPEFTWEEAGKLRISAGQAPLGEGSSGQENGELSS